MLPGYIIYFWLSFYNEYSGFIYLQKEEESVPVLWAPLSGTFEVSAFDKGILSESAPIKMCLGTLARTTLTKYSWKCSHASAVAVVRLHLVEGKWFLHSFVFFFPPISCCSQSWSLWEEVRVIRGCNYQFFICRLIRSLRLSARPLESRSLRMAEWCPPSPSAAVTCALSRLRSSPALAIAICLRRSAQALHKLHFLTLMLRVFFLVFFVHFLCFSFFYYYYSRLYLMQSCLFSVLFIVLGLFLHKTPCELSHGRRRGCSDQPPQGRPHPRVWGLQAPSHVEAGHRAWWRWFLHHIHQTGQQKKWVLISRRLWASHRHQGLNQNSAAFTSAKVQEVSEAAGGRRALALHILPWDVQSWGEPAWGVPGCARPHQAVHLQGELHAVCGEYALPLHVWLGGRFLGPVLVRFQRRAVLCALAGASRPLHNSALHVLLPTTAGLPPLRRGVPLLRRQAQSRRLSRGDGGETHGHVKKQPPPSLFFFHSPLEAGEVLHPPLWRLWRFDLAESSRSLWPDLLGLSSSRHRAHYGREGVYGMDSNHEMGKKNWKRDTKYKCQTFITSWRKVVFCTEIKTITKKKTGRAYRGSAVWVC